MYRKILESGKKDYEKDFFLLSTKFCSHLSGVLHFWNFQVLLNNK